MKALTHGTSAIPALLMQEWLFLPGVCLPDTAWALAAIANGFKKPDVLPDSFTWIYKLGHSLLVWGPLAVLGWRYPWLRPLFCGVLLHLILDYPTHTNNQPLYPFTWGFDGKGA